MIIHIPKNQDSPKIKGEHHGITFPGMGPPSDARHLAALMGHGAPGGLGLEFFFLHEEMLGPSAESHGSQEGCLGNWKELQSS